MESKAEANGRATEISLLRGIRAKGYRILQNAGHSHILTRTALRNRLDDLRLVKPTRIDSPGGATAAPSTGGGRPARRASRFASLVKGGHCPRGPTTPGRPTVYPSVTNIPQAAARNARSGSRQ